MKSVLYVTKHFPPDRTVSSKRAAKMVKYLADYGWRAVVLTWTNDELPKDTTSWNVENTEVHRIARKNIIELATSGVVPVSESGPRIQEGESRSEISKGNVQSAAIWTTMRKWFNSAKVVSDTTQVIDSNSTNLGERLCRENNISAIISSFPPARAHYLAWRIQRRTSLPWIAEFRDEWSRNQYIEKIRPIEKFEALLEKRLLSDCTLIATVSPTMSQQFQSIYGKKTVTIFNGFDEKDFDLSAEKSEIFTIGYTGGIIPLRRDPSALLAAAKDLLKEGRIAKDDFKIKFVCDRSQWLSQAVDGSLLNSGVLSISKSVSYKESLKLQREATVLLLLSWNDERDAATLTGKLFDYLGAGRPILAIAYKNGEIARVLRETGSGVVENSVGGLKEIVAQWVKEFKADRQIRSYYKPDKLEIQRYTCRRQAEILSESLNEVTSGALKKERKNL